MPAEVVPPVDCYYQQKDFPIALAETVSPLSPGGCYPIWEEMNRGPLTPYEVSVDRISTEGAQWSKQALCQHQHIRHLRKKKKKIHCLAASCPPHHHHQLQGFKASDLQNLSVIWKQWKMSISKLCSLFFFLLCFSLFLFYFLFLSFVI